MAQSHVPIWSLSPNAFLSLSGVVVSLALCGVREKCLGQGSLQPNSEALQAGEALRVALWLHILLRALLSQTH